MTLNEYQNGAVKTRLPSATVEYLYTNLSGEVGELMSLRAKAIRDGARGDYELNIKKELGDILWHIATIAHQHNWTLREIAVANLLKLALRREQGKLQGSGDDR